jgi:hypothetical protein
LTKLQERGNVVLLPPEFAEERRETEQQLDYARKIEKDSGLALGQLSAERQGLIVPQGLLAHAETISLLQQRLGSHRKAAQDRARLLGQQRQLEDDVQALLARLPPPLSSAQVKKRRLETAHRARVQELARQYQARVERVDRATRDVQKSVEQLTKTQAGLNACQTPGDATELRRAVHRARQQGDVEHTREQVRAALQMEEAQAHIEIARLGLWHGTLDELERLVLPSRETVDRYETAFNKLNAEGVHVDEDLHHTQGDVAELDRRLDELRLAGAVPREEDLVRTRQRRDQLWQAVRRAWLDDDNTDHDANPRATPGSLAETYAGSVGQADEVADRLRREAERVTRQAELLAQREKAATILEHLAAQRHILTAERRQQHEQWQQLWQSAGITPLSPREMRSWLDRQGILTQRAERLREYRHQLGRLDDRLHEHALAVRHALERLGEGDVRAEDTLGALLTRGETLIETIDDAMRQRRELQKQLATATGDLEGARRDQHEAADLLAQWQSAWTAAVAGLGLDGQALPVEAHAVLEGLDALLKKQDEADGLAQRIDGIDRDAETFLQAVRNLAAQVAPDLMAAPVEQTAVQLHARLVRAQTDAARKIELDKQIAKQEGSLTEAQSTIERMTERLYTLCRQAGCAHPDELPAAEVRSSQLQQWQNDLAACEAQLLEQGGGGTLEHLMQEAAAVDADGLPAQLVEITRHRHELESRRSDLDQTIGREQTIVDQMDGSALAAAAADKAQTVLAELRGGIERYVRLRLASMLLRREIERYRVSHQGPLLRRASELFSQLTLGSFCKLETDYNEQDKPVLIGVRPDGQRVDVRGMSEGTCDQLFLALRLASLEQFLVNNEPLPFIVDDILVQFDDLRAEAALQVLAQLSTKTQVIFLTHHWRLVELAQKVGGHEVAMIQLLGT